MKVLRRKARVVKIGDVCIGGSNPIAIQSMTKTKTQDVGATIKQIKELEALGCQIVRSAVKDKDDAEALREIKKAIAIPLVADIHFDWRLAIKAIDSGVDKIRLNPGNIYKKEQVRQIASAAKINRIPIRVGVNSGSLPQNKNRKSKTLKIQDAMVKSALDYVKILEGIGFYDIVISLKASNILDTIEAYRKVSKLCDYPLHLGVTATGFSRQGLIKSSIAIGVLLLEGIGDTIRVSLTDTPSEEVKAARFILETLGLYNWTPEIISCPTCGRCEVDLVKIVNELEQKLSVVSCQLSVSQPKVAIMGCVVNGPGEAKEADIGIAFGKDKGLLFKHGRPIKKVAIGDCVEVLLKEMGRFDE